MVESRMARPKSMENRAELVTQAAQELFARYGYERTSIEDIAEHLGIGKGSIYLAFKTKEDIFLAILEKHLAELRKLVDESVENCGRSPMSSLKTMLEQFVLFVYETVTRDRHSPEMQLHTSRTAKKRFPEMEKHIESSVFAFLRKSADADEIPEESATRENARTVLLMLAGVMPPYVDRCGLMDGDTPDRAKLLAHTRRLIKLALNGLKYQSES